MISPVVKFSTIPCINTRVTLVSKSDYFDFFNILGDGINKVYPLILVPIGLTGNIISFLVRNVF